MLVLKYSCVAISEVSLSRDEESLLLGLDTLEEEALLPLNSRCWLSVLWHDCCSLESESSAPVD